MTRLRRIYWAARGYPRCAVCQKRVRHDDMLHMRMIHRDGSRLCQETTP